MSSRARLLAPASLLVVFLLVMVPCVAAENIVLRELSDGQKVSIYASSLALLACGKVASNMPAERPIDHAYCPNRLDLFARKVIHGEVDTSTNFIDRKYGGIMTPAVCLISIGIMDIGKREFSRDIPMYLAGLAATNGVTTIIKSIANRPRPYCLPGGAAPSNRPENSADHHRSFLSGHSSMAFYGATFLNLRARQFMRDYWTEDEYKVGRFLSPVMTFGWAGIVGISRIHADKHYFTDVLAGALVGTVIAELYYWLSYEAAGDDTLKDGERLRLSMTIRF